MHRAVIATTGIIFTASLAAALSFKCPPVSFTERNITGCYVVSRNAGIPDMTWAEAQLECGMKYFPSGDLATIFDEWTNSFVSEQLRKTAENYWIGGVRRLGGTWAWSDDRKVEYANWVAGMSAGV